MLRRTFLLLAGPAGLTACATGPYPGYYAAPGTRPPGRRSGGGKVAILLPRTGAHADLAEPLLQAAQLALATPGSPELIPEDTAGTPEGAAAATRAALAAGATLILGPLTAPEVAAAAPIARSAGVSVLAFSNDPAVAQPGVWPLGITPGQQVRRLLAAAQQAGKSRVAGLLPDTDFGRALGTALTNAAAAEAMPPPTIEYHAPGMNPINHAVRALSDYDARWGPIQAKIRAARATGSSEGRREAAQLRTTALAPPPFDALLIGDSGDEALTEVAAMLPYYFVNQPAVQFMGPSLWANPRSGARQFRGAWYAAPDPAARADFVAAYSARYGSPPPSVADIAYDAASIAKATGGDGAPATLTNRAGFTGADGAMLLLQNGDVRRGLAVFQIEPGGPQVVQPASSPTA